jgi:adenine-specific DNA-methyltransferase
MGDDEMVYEGIESVGSSSPDLVSDRIEQLKSIFPEAFSEDKVDFEKLKMSLGDIIDDKPERYSFSWAGKRNSIQLLQTPSHATLVPDQEESVNFDSTQNVFIEGDNLEVLKLLYKSYSGRIKMIYIDPPYNTGNDFVYPDNYADPLETYLEITGQKDAQGNLLTSNPESSGRYHSAWLSMMYPRLYLARQLLREDGVIFVSIDDHEVYNLRLLMNEIFGEENFIACVANVNNPKGRSDDKFIATAHECVLIYKKEEVVFGGWEPEENILRRYNKVSEDGTKYREIDLRKTGDNDRREDRPNLFYYFLFNPQTKDFYCSRDVRTPEGYIQIVPLREDSSFGNWRWELDTSRQRMDKLVPKLMPVRKIWSVFEIDPYIPGEKIKPTSAWTKKEFNSERGSDQFIELGFDKNDFQRPKPVGLLKHILELGTAPNSGDIVLDIFAGSGTTAQAVFELNSEDDGNRRYIMVQLPELIDEKKYPKAASEFSTVANVGKERIRRVISKMKREEESQLDLSTREYPEDLGFRVFKLAPSNYKVWEYAASDPESYTTQAVFFTDPLKEGWKAEDVIWEVAIKEGYGLNSQIKHLEEIQENTAWRITDPDKDQSFLICLDKTLAASTISSLPLFKDQIFVCLDAALDDTLAANLALQCRLKKI